MEYYIFKDVGLYSYKDEKTGDKHYDLACISEEIEERLREATGLKIDVTITEQ